jgi:hypothetical protein
MRPNLKTFASAARDVERGSSKKINATQQMTNIDSGSLFLIMVRLLLGIMKTPFLCQHAALIGEIRGRSG